MEGVRMGGRDLSYLVVRTRDKHTLLTGGVSYTRKFRRRSLHDDQLKFVP